MRTLVSSVAGFLLAGVPAAAQGVSLADVLAANVSCASASDARTSLRRALAQAPADATKDAKVSALRELAGRESLCTELRTAARDLADPPIVVADKAVAAEIPAPVAASPDKADERTAGYIPPAPNSIVAAALAEAERRAANLRFDVGPPPLFMTRERNPRP